MFSIRIFSIKWRNLFVLPFLSPSGLTLPNCRFKAIPASRVARSAERGLFKISPYVTASPCLKKNSANFIFFGKNVKPCLTSRLPLGGKVDKAKLWTNEGQPNNNQAFSRQKVALYSTRVPGFPVGEAVGFCRLKRSLPVFPLPEKKFSKLHFFRQKCEALPCVKPSPCLIVLAHNKAKIVSRFAASPRGEAPCKARW